VEFLIFLILIHEGSHLLVAVLFGSSITFKLIDKDPNTIFGLAIQGLTELPDKFQNILCTIAGVSVNFYAIYRTKRSRWYYLISLIGARTDIYWTLRLMGVIT